MKITEALVLEHEVFNAVFAHIERLLPQTTELGEVRLLSSLVESLLLDHADTENNLAFVALDHVLAHRGQFDRLYQDHQELDTRYHQVGSAATLADARRLLQQALAASRQHFRFEEEHVFPVIEQMLQDATLNELGRVWMCKSKALSN